MTPGRPPRRLALLWFVMLAACSSPTPSPIPCPVAAPTTEQATNVLADADLAVVKTNKGEFTIELYGEAAPIATANFVRLARCRFYDDISFHRVIAGFVIQAGDPQTKTNRGDFDGLGAGRPGYHFTIEAPAEGLNYDPYVVAMANAGGTDTNGSQFFIDLADLDDQLPRSYTIFGKVVAGTDVVDAIGAIPTSGSPRDIPLDPVIIETITVQAKPAESPSPG
jgi:cyclophilin family peptidyl-prolyl cis-trans isomerase